MASGSLIKTLPSPFWNPTPWGGGGGGIWHFASAQEMLILRLKGLLFTNIRVFLCFYPIVNPNPVVLNYFQRNQNSGTFFGMSSASCVLSSKWHLGASCCPIPGCTSASDGLFGHKSPLQQSLLLCGYLTLLPQTLQNLPHWHQFGLQRPPSTRLIDPSRLS